MKKIGKYEIQGEIGRGGMGVVYKAYDPYLEEIVAVKTMSAEYSSEEGFRKKFFEEGKKTRRLKHENIIEVLDLDEHEGLPYLAMEFLEGRDLNDEIVSHKLVSLEQKLRIMKEVCAGLAYAHQKGTIHLDIKPGNIFLTAAGQVKILDFGLARAATSVSMSTKLMGTPHYMPPEQWDRKVDERTDIFAATAVFYELLTHRKAFDGEGWGEVYYQIRNIDPPPPDRINPDIPSELSRIVMRSLAKDPAERHQRMEEFQQAIEEFEPTLEEKKRSLLAEALDAIGNLSQLIKQNSDLFPKEAAEATDSATVEQPTSDYFALLQLCHRARRDYELTERLIEKRRQALPIIEKATVLERGGDLEEAVELLDGVLQNDPSNLQAVSLHNELLSRIEQKRLEEERELQVRDLLQEAAARFSSDLTGSQALLEEVLRLRPGHEAAVALQEKVQQRLQEQAELEEKSRQLAESLESARKALESGDFKRARQTVDKARQLHGEAPGIAEVLEGIERSEQEHRALREKERTVSAIRAEEELAQIQSELTQARKFLMSEDFDSARTHLLKVLALSQDHPLAKEMIEKIDQVQEERNKRERIAALLVQSQLALSQQNYEEAGRRAREVLLLDPQNEEALSLRARSDRAQEESIRRAKWRTALRFGAALLAVALLITAGVRISNLSADFSGRAAAFLKEGKYGDAQRALDQWFLLGQARELKEKVTRVQEAHKTFGLAIAKSDYKTASGAFDQILTINPSDPDLRRYQEEIDKTFSTDFSDEFASLKNWDAPATWSVDQAKKMLLVRGPGIGLVVNKFWKDSRVAFGLSFVNRKGAVWILRARNREDYYMFQIVSSGIFKSFSCRSGEIQELKSRTIPKNLSNPDDYFRIIIEATENEITHSLQTRLEPDEHPIKIDILTDRSHRAGSFGFGTKDGEEFNVTDFLVQPLEQKTKPASN